MSSVKYDPETKSCDCGHSPCPMAELTDLRTRVAENELVNLRTRVVELGEELKSAKRGSADAKILMNNHAKRIGVLDRRSEKWRKMTIKLETTITEKDAEIERLRELVESAFREGNSDGWADGLDACHYNSESGVEASWKYSDSKKALDPDTGEEVGGE